MGSISSLNRIIFKFSSSFMANQVFTSTMNLHPY